jgi:hypothetical protein
MQNIASERTIRMTPSDNSSPSSPRSDTGLSSLQAAIENMTVSLTVVYAQTQLLRRRIETGRVEAAVDCLHALETIERHAADLALRLHQAHDESTGRSTSVIGEPSRRIA